MNFKATMTWISRRLTPARGAFAGVLLAACSQTSFAQELVQTFQLQPGWNAIYVEVELGDKRIDPLFTNLPVASIWTWKARVTAADFIQHPDERLANQDRWLVYYARSSPESRFNTLFALLPRRAYLIKLKGTTPVTLTLKGRPSLRQAEWAANAYNLRGFSVDPEGPPTFRDFFQHSKAHYDRAQSRLQPVYRLDPTGRWDPVPAEARMRRGEAYWVYTDGASTYAGPFTVDEFSGTGPSGDGLEFGLELDTITLRFSNQSDLPTVFTILHRSEGALPLAYRVFPSYGPEIGWLNLPQEHNFLVNGPGAQEIGFAVRRSAFSAPSYQNVIEVTDSRGTLVYVPVSAAKPAAAAGGFSPAAKAGLRSTQAQAPAAGESQGLWVGSATIQAVSEPHSGTLITNRSADGGLVISRVGVSTNATPTKSTFDLRLLFHVSGDGTGRLLKEVTVLEVSPAYTNDAQGNLVVAQPAYTVLLTDRNLFACYAAAGITGERPVGRRLSSVHFDFETPAVLSRVVTGVFMPGGSIQCAVTNLPVTPTHPFRHKFHPDHDGLDANYRFPNDEVNTVVRQIEMVFDAVNQTTLIAADSYDTLGGSYRETIIGLHKDPIHCRGAFRLNRVSAIGELDPPCPGLRTAFP